MFERPSSIKDATRLLAEGGWSIVAGGTDFYPGLRDQLPTGPVMDITAIDGLNSIEETPDYWRIGALTTWTSLIEFPLPPAFDALKLSAREVGSVQIQNRATIVGNICNASPAADGVPALMILDARVELTSQSGRRCLALDDFVEGNRKTAIRADEIVTAVLVPKLKAAGVSHFVKLGARKYLVISIAMVAVRLEVSNDGHITDVAVSVGSCSEVAKRFPSLERALTGQVIGRSSNPVVSDDHIAGLTPIDDVRASGKYRLMAANELIRRALQSCMAQSSKA